MGTVVPAQLPGYKVGVPERPRMSADEAADALEHICTVALRCAVDFSLGVGAQLTCPRVCSLTRFPSG